MFLDLTSGHDLKNNKVVQSRFWRFFEYSWPCVPTWPRSRVRWGRVSNPRPGAFGAEHRPGAGQSSYRCNWPVNRYTPFRLCGRLQLFTLISIKNLWCNILSCEVVFDSSKVPFLTCISTLNISTICHFNDMTKFKRHLTSESLCTFCHF